MSSSQTNPKEVGQDLLIFPSAHGAPRSPTLLRVGWEQRGSSRAVNIPGGLVNVQMAAMVLTEGSALPLPRRKVSDTHEHLHDFRACPAAGRAQTGGEDLAAGLGRVNRGACIF